MIQMSKPLAVLISDIHYSLSTLELADRSLRSSIYKANELRCPLIIAGDLHDTKANLRAECVSALINTFKQAEVTIYLLIGNHDLQNERTNLRHSLDFLDPYSYIVKDSFEGPFGTFFAYQPNPDDFEKRLKVISAGKIVIMHQGLKGTDSGEYFHDRTAISYESCKHLRVISGHYHKRQTFKEFDYIGNPYTLNFGEASTEAKGYQILLENGQLEFVPLDLPRHTIVELSLDIGKKLIKIERTFRLKKEDKVWVKVYGESGELYSIKKEEIAKFLEYEGEFRLEKIQIDKPIAVLKNNTVSQEEMLDEIIDSLDKHQIYKNQIKALWRKL
jgi:DNA repair exonuclease SbcCD nuclease subunit